MGYKRIYTKLVTKHEKAEFVLLIKKKMFSRVIKTIDTLIKSREEKEKKSKEEQCGEEQKCNVGSEGHSRRTPVFRLVLDT